MAVRLILLFVFLAAPIAGAREAQSIRVVVALCDNATQGIVKVGARIGDGNKPNDNLYWGCSDGLREWFKKSPNWTTVSIEKDDAEEAKILETATFQHKRTGSVLIAEAWRGSEIEAATNRYLSLLSMDADDRPDFVAYIGHNGLMDIDSPDLSLIRATEEAPDTSILCCISQRSFSPILEVIGSRPILMTEQLMYPGSFLLDAALEGWLRRESRDEIRARAAVAYAKNQGITPRAARTIFTDFE